MTRPSSTEPAAVLGASAAGDGPSRAAYSQAGGPRLYAIRGESDCLSRTSTDAAGRLALELVVADLRRTILAVLREPAVVVHAGTGDVPEHDRALVALLDRTPVRVEVARPRRRHGAAARGRLACLFAQGDVGLEERLRVGVSGRGGRRLDEAPRQRGGRCDSGRPVR